MKIRLQQLNPTVGAIRENSTAVIGALREAEGEGVELLILPELAVAGYPPMDLLERPAFREEIYRANRRIIEATAGTGLLFGSVTRNDGGTGRPCFNAALLASGGRLRGEARKTLLPTYDVFDDLRYFEPGTGGSCLEWKGRKLGVTICEDIWYNENDIQYHVYETNPAEELAGRGAEAIVNISASPYTRGKPAARLEMLRGHAKRLKLPLFYANQVGANTEIIFDGDSMALDAGGAVAGRVPLFEEGFTDVRWEPGGGLKAAASSPRPADDTGTPDRAPEGPPGEVFRALRLGLGDYLRKTGAADRVVLGLSGGIDSALGACIAAEAVGADRVTALTMPSEYSSEDSVADSEYLADRLGVTLHELPISALHDAAWETLEPLLGAREEGVTDENLQPRIRQLLLMAFSNRHGHLLLNTGNKSELATGYCTLYGDMAGGLALISDLYKTEVYEMARWLNESYYGEEVIPGSTLRKPPSAELRPGQADSDLLPDYGVLDPVLRRYIERRESPEEIVEAGYDRETVRKILRMVQRSEFKRQQAVPGLKVTVKAFGGGRRWPVAEGWTRALNEAAGR